MSVSFTNPSTLIARGQSLNGQADTPANREAARKTVTEMRELISTAKDAVASNKRTQREIDAIISPDQVNRINALVPQLVDKYGLEYSKTAQAGLFAAGTAAVIGAATWFRSLIPASVNSADGSIIARGVNATLNATATYAPVALEAITSTSWGKVAYGVAALVVTGLSVFLANKYFSKPQQQQA